MRQYRGRKKIVKSVRSWSGLEKAIVALSILIILLLLCLILVFPNELRIITRSLTPKISPPSSLPSTSTEGGDGGSNKPIGGEQLSSGSPSPSAPAISERVAGAKFNQGFSFLSNDPVSVPQGDGSLVDSWINETMESIMVAVGATPFTASLPAPSDSQGSTSTVAIFPTIAFRDRNDKMLAAEKDTPKEKRGHSHVDWERVYKAQESFQMPTWATRPERNVLESASIFVSIAAFRDEECATTLKSLLTQARSPHRIYAGISEERMDSETDCLSLLELDKPETAKQLLWGRGAPEGLHYERRPMKWSDIMGEREVTLVSSATKKASGNSLAESSGDPVTTTTTTTSAPVTCTCEASPTVLSSSSPALYHCAEDKNVTLTECIAEQVHFFAQCLEKTSDTAECSEQHSQRIEECQNEKPPVHRCVKDTSLRNFFASHIASAQNITAEEEKGETFDPTALFPPLFQCRQTLEEGTKVKGQEEIGDKNNNSSAPESPYHCVPTKAKRNDVLLMRSMTDMGAVFEVFHTPFRCVLLQTTETQSSPLLQCLATTAEDNGENTELETSNLPTSSSPTNSCECSMPSTDPSTGLSTETSSPYPADSASTNSATVYMDASYKKDTLTCIAGNVETARDTLVLALHGRLPSTHHRYSELTNYLSKFSAEQLALFQQWFPIREGTSIQQRASAALAGCRFTTRVTPPESARGPTYGRYITSLLYFNQDYYMVVDSHSRFSVHWDSKMILRIFQLPTYGVLSHYPNGYTPESPEAEYDKDDVMGMCKGVILANGMPKLGANWMPLRPHPTLEAFAAAGYIFGDAQFVLDTPFDPFLHYLFDGEEILYSVRMWTSGWDIYCPAEPNIFHHYGRPKAPKFWSLMNARKTQIQQLSERRALYLLQRAQPWVQDKERFPGHEYIPPSERLIVKKEDVERHPRIALEEELYGLGTNRTLEAFWDFSQLNDNYVMTRDNENRWEGGEGLCEKQKDG